MTIWRHKGEEVIRGTKTVKQLDPYVRRDNLRGLFVPPPGVDLKALVKGKASLIVDDLATYHMTMKDIARTLIEHGSAGEVGAVLWMSDD
jgi:predicted amidophosphoribosyltransferase